MRASARMLCVCVLLSACGKDPMAGRKGSGGDAGHPEITSNEKDFDPGLVAAWKWLRDARMKRDETAWRSAFAGTPSAEAMELFTETATARLARIVPRFQKQEIKGERATLALKERVEERDPANPKGEVLGLDVQLDMELVQSGGAWKIQSLRVGW